MSAVAAKTLSIKMDDQMRQRIKSLADSRHRTTHWVMREAITQYVEREEKRETFRRDTMQAWDDYQTNGLHATSEEVDAWLTKLADGDDVAPPECHV